MKSFYCICLFFGLSLSAFADYASDRAAIVALGNLTSAPTTYEVDTSTAVYQSSEIVTSLTPSATEQTLEGIFFDSVDYLGSPTRVYALVGMPQWEEGDDPLPAIVLVHGGSGQAYATWANLWAERGYVAIAIDTEGASNTTGRHSKGGPRRTGVFNESNITIGDQFMYHATAGTILANSLMRSLPFVDETKVGVHGVSWGGVITSNVIGVDNRFAFAIPTYGCGHMWDGIGKWQEAISNVGGTDYYKNIWDPMLYLENATMPIMWLTWLNDSTFNMDGQANSYNQAPGTRMVSIIQGMKHSHAWTWSRADSYDFADSIVGNNAGSVGLRASDPWCVQQSLSLVGDQVAVAFESTRPLTSATLYHSNQMGDIKAFSWTTVTLTDFAETSPDSGIWQGTATLPSDATTWFVNVTADTSIFEVDYLPNETTYLSETIYVSSRLQEVVKVEQPAPVAIEVAEGEISATASVSVDFTAIYNLEITSVEFVNTSHAGAFSTVEPFTFGLIADTAFDVTFDNAVAGLNAGETANATLRLTWVALDNVTTNTIDIPLSATVTATTAYEFTWDGGGTNNRWTVAENWVDDTKPSANSDVIFSDVGGRTTSNIYSDTTLKSLMFDGSIDDVFEFNVFRSSAYNLNLTLENGGSPATVTVDAGSAGDCVISDLETAGSIILNDSLDLVHNGSGSLTFDLAITQQDGEANGITKTGQGAVILSGTNAYTGDTIVAAGSVTLASGGILTFAPTTDGVSNQLAGVVAGTGTAHVQGELYIDLDDADSTQGNNWSLVDGTALTLVYAADTFSVNSSQGAFSNNAGVWTWDNENTRWSFTEATGILEVTTVSAAAYTAWTTGSFTHSFTESGALVDFDGDGLNNLLEFVFGGDPTISETGISPTVSESDADLQLTFRRSDASKQSPFTTVTIELSEDLTFTSSDNDIAIGSSSDAGPIGSIGASYTVTNSDGFDWVIVTIPMDAISSNFVRLVIAQP
ncbi:acetylxylan esterase [Puniceicoccaceae bacterium]|nr:acetylxylan esterase [Puniceicoccaceae bacterium]